MTTIVKPYLKHYGVKGMKWGVRKDHHRDYVPRKATKATSSPLQRTQAKVNMMRYTAKASKLKSRVAFDEKWYDSLDTGKEFVAAGSILNRIVKGVDENALSGRLYVSQLLSDSNMYKATIPAVQVKMSYGKKEYHSVYQVDLVTKKKLAMPSARERVDTFIETLQTPGGKEWLKANGYKGEIDEINAKQVGLNFYQTFNKYAGNQSVAFNDQYFDAIKSKGYNALLDDNDAGIWSKKPTILLDLKGTVRITDVRQLTADEINKAQKDVLKLRQF